MGNVESKSTNRKVRDYEKKQKARRAKAKTSTEAPKIDELAQFYEDKAIVEKICGEKFTDEDFLRTVTLTDTGLHYIDYLSPSVGSTQSLGFGRRNLQRLDSLETLTERSKLESIKEEAEEVRTAVRRATIVRRGPFPALESEK